MARQHSTETVSIPAVASDRQIATIVSLVDQMSRVTRPRFYGLDKIADPRMLLVGNHTVYGVFDVPCMVAGIYKRHGHRIRSLGDHRHWLIPGWGKFLEGVGAVRGTRETTAELMCRGEPILVFPGGSREVNKRRDEKYQLIWKNRLGFAQLAIEHEYPIVPFSAVGGEEVFDVISDDGGRIHGALSSLTKRAVGLPIPSIVRGVGPTMIPRPQRFYFRFADPIPTTPYRGKGDDGARELRDRVAGEIEYGIEFLLAQRRADPARKLMPRLLGR